MKVKKSVLAGLLLLVLSCLAVVGGCQSEALRDGYQFGDGAAALVDGAVTVAELRDRYCNEGDQMARQLLLVAVRSVQPDYPEDGICTDVAGLVSMLAGESEDVEARP